LSVKSIKKAWISILGNENEFSLEARVFHAICLISIFILLTSLPINYTNGLFELVILMGGFIFVAVLAFYLSRYRKKLNYSVNFFSIAANFFFVSNFYFNSGIAGPGLMFFLLCIFLTTIIVPKKQYFFWLILNIVEVIILLVISYREPDLFINRFPNSLSQYFDIGASYILTAILIFIATDFIRKSYNLEKGIVEEKAEELKASNDTKNKLLSILAHDLRSPLGSIQNYLEMLSELDLDEKERKNITSSLLSETQNTQQMLSNILSWSKSQMDGVIVNLQEINLKEVLMPAIRAQQTRAVEKSIHVETGINEVVNILADKDMLQLVVRNLLNNAVKFTAEGGKISIRSSIENKDCLITITDTGQGIPYELQADLFSMKVKSTYGTRNEKGVGLGLSICKEFAEIQNGKIWFDSVPGEGTTFYISLALSSNIRIDHPKNLANTKLN
jgi:signal transduction histidine kinase